METLLRMLSMKARKQQLNCIYIAFIWEKFHTIKRVSPDKDSSYLNQAQF